MTTTQKTFDVSVAPADTPPPLTITSISPLPNAKVGQAYGAQLQASGGVAPYTWSVVGGALPGGLALNASTGAITGTPTASGPFQVTVQVADSAP